MPKRSLTLQSFSDGALRAGRRESRFYAGSLPLSGTGMTLLLSITPG